MEDSYHHHHRHHHHHQHSKHRCPPRGQNHQSNRQPTFPPPPPPSLPSDQPYLQPAFHGPHMHDFPRGVGILPGGPLPPPPPPRFGIPRELFNGGPPPPPPNSLLSPHPSRSSHHPSHMSWPAEAGWHIRSPFMGEQVNFPGHRDVGFPPDFNHHQRGGNTRMLNGSEPPMSFHSHLDDNYAHRYHQHKHRHMNGSEGRYLGEWSTRVNGNQFVRGGVSGVAQSQSETMSKKMKTNLPKLRTRTPIRPLVDINKELKLKHSTHISIVTYNLLAQDLIDKNMHLYNERDPEHLKWDFRKENLLKELIESGADILCLQELQDIHYQTWLFSRLSKHGIFKKRTGSHLDGCALFYLKSKLRLLESNGLEYQRGFKVLNRDNVALLAKFAVAEEGVDSDSAVFCVANTHLLFNPKAGEVKLAQLSYLLAELHKLALKPGTNELNPVLICGDFNSIPQSPLLDFITSSILNYSKLSALVVSGYYEEGERSRVIPIPLLPKEMNIMSNCVYGKPTKVGDDNTVVKKGKKALNSEVIIIRNDRVDEDDSTKKQNVKSHSEQCGLKNPHTAPALPVQGGPHSFESSLTDTESYANRPMKTTRSVRGSSSRERRSSAAVNISDFRSLLGSASTGKRGRDHSDYLSTDEFKSPISGGKSPISGESSVAGDSAIDSLGSSLSSISKSTSSGIKKHKEINSATTNRGGSSHQNRTNPTDTPAGGVLLHPFKLVSAYPHSKSMPATVTTFHQRAFETVDYIFYNPVTYQATSSKKQLSGFNLLKRKVLPSNHTLLDLGPQPHCFLSSDHLLLQAIFQFSW